jgi:hypothetical protein
VELVQCRIPLKLGSQISILLLEANRSWDALGLKLKRSVKPGREFLESSVLQQSCKKEISGFEQGYVFTVH